MSMPIPISQYLSHHRVDYAILKHKPTPGAWETAQAAAIPLEQLVHSIVLQQQQHQENLLMVLIPASHQLDIAKVRRATGEPYRLLERPSIKAIFQDCQPGVIPGLGQPFDLEMLTDIRLFQVPQVYLEDGDATELIKLQHPQFLTLMSSAPRHDLCHTT
ncbi:MAG: YbaK/EbsC family protein [Halopseudomonas sp.]